MQGLDLRNANAAIGKVQHTGVVAPRWPIIVDFDVAGEIFDVGADVEKFKNGDRVIA